jgi:hypothetical protein
MLKAVITLSLAVLLCAACSGGPVSQKSAPNGVFTERSNWAALAGRRIFFGHQSVGYNIVDGVTELLRQNQQPVLRIEETVVPDELQPGVLAHAAVGTNGDPSSKMRAFAEYMDSGLGARSDLALLKFCYIDVDANTDIKKVFAEYKQVMGELKKRHPATRFVHATMPLRLVQTGPKALVKRLLSRPAGGYVENVQRNLYNEMLRREYEGREPLFDIARLESETADNAATTFTFHGQEYFALNASYTPDNGHLNEQGRRVVAAGLLDALAGALEPRAE